MFQDIIEYPITSKKLQWTSKQVLRDIDDHPHLFQRFTLSGTLFPERALKPFVKIGKQVTTHVVIAADGLSANAYFDRPVADDQRIEYGYGDEVFLFFPRQTIQREVLQLDIKRIPAGTKNVEYFAGPAIG
jgi:hypothetical protein